MKRVWYFQIILSVLLGSSVFAQVNLVEYEYWFNNDNANAVVVPITPSANLNLSTVIDASELPEGLQLFNFRVKDENNLYSSIITRAFFKNTEQFTSNKKLIAYEYWFNNDDENLHYEALTPTASHELVTSIDVSQLEDGVNVIHMRYIDENNFYSGALSAMFFKKESTIINNKITGYQYWFNNDDENLHYEALTPTVSHELFTSIDVSQLTDGVNLIHLRYVDENNLYSSTLSAMFYKKESTIINNKISGYQFWFDNDFENATYISLPEPTPQLILNNSIDLTQLSHGEHVLHYQFHDSLHVWSVVTSDTIVKTSLPVAGFNYTLNESCDSTVASFTNLSVDADKYLWDFGDGITDSIAEPSHTYYLPGKYTVNLTVLDTITLVDSTWQVIIPVKGKTDSTFSVTACDSYESPGGKMYYSSAICYDTIPNSMGCDSLLTIQLTINNLPDVGLTQQGYSLIADADDVSYQWVNCENTYEIINGETNKTFTASANGDYAVIISDANCTDTSICYTVSGITLVENSFDNVVAVYPNPSQGSFYVYLNETYDYIEYKIIDMQGKVLQNGIAYDVSILPIEFISDKGIYILQISNRELPAEIKIMIE